MSYRTASGVSLCMRAGCHESRGDGEKSAEKGDAGAVPDVDSGGDGDVSNSLDYKRVGSGGKAVYDDSTGACRDRAERQRSEQWAADYEMSHAHVTHHPHATRRSVSGRRLNPARRVGAKGVDESAHIPQNQRRLPAEASPGDQLSFASRSHARFLERTRSLMPKRVTSFGASSDSGLDRGAGGEKGLR